MTTILLLCKSIYIETSNLLIIKHAGYFRAFPEYANCEVIAIPAKYDFKPYAYGFQKDSPYLGIFNFYLKDMREKGTLKQILTKYESPPQVCPDYSGQPLGFDSCFTAFGILLLGAGFGLILYFVEWTSLQMGVKLHWMDWYGRGNVPSDGMDDDHECKHSFAVQRLEQELAVMRRKLAKFETNFGFHH